MKHKQPKVINYTIESVYKVTCDLCQQEIKQTELYKLDEITISREHGSQWPDGGGHGTKVEVDMCGTCFETKFEAWLKSQGVTPTRTEWDH